MALPFTISTTYAPGAQVKSADLNAIQVAIVNEHNKPLHFAAAAFASVSDPTKHLVGYGGAWQAVVSAGALTGGLDLSPWLIPGDIIKDITWRWRNGATPSAGSVDFTFSRAPIATPHTITGIDATTQNTNTGGALGLRSVLRSLNHTVLASNYYALACEFNATAGNDQVGFGGVTITLGA